MTSNEAPAPTPMDQLKAALDGYQAANPEWHYSLTENAYDAGWVRKALGIERRHRLSIRLPDGREEDVPFGDRQIPQLIGWVQEWLFEYQ